MKRFKQFLIEQNEEVKCDINGICNVTRKYESAGNEEKILSIYPDSKGLPTIGHGHLITTDTPKIFSEVFAEEEKNSPGFISNILDKGGRMTPEQAERLFQRDVRVRLPEIKKMIPKFESFTPELQGELFSEYYRGMVPKSPNAVRLLNAGDYAGASKEYLDADDYRNAVRDKTGIATRMENLSKAMATELDRQKVNAIKTAPIKDKIAAAALEYAPAVLDMVSRIAEPIGGLPTASESKPQESESSSTTYVVKSGDNLTKISNNNKQLMDAIIKANNIKNPNLIKPGQKLIIPK